MTKKMLIKIENNKIKFLGGKIPKDGVYNVSFQENNRTLQQNKALHKFFTLLADELKNNNIDKREFFKESYFTDWTPESVKEEIWRPLQKALFQTTSTTKLKRGKQIEIIYDHINRILIEKLKGRIMIPPFPSIENYIEQSHS